MAWDAEDTWDEVDVREGRAGLMGVVSDTAGDWHDDGSPRSAIGLFSSQNREASALSWNQVMESAPSAVCMTVCSLSLCRKRERFLRSWATS